MPKISIALVGHRNSPDDAWRKARCEALYRSMMDLPIGAEFSYDPIDLVDGRDFLTEKLIYDAVILQLIFRGNEPSATGYTHGSKLSSWSNWRKRLMGTGAKVIFA